MKIIGLESSIRQNRFRLTYLISLMPLIILLIILIYSFIIYETKEQVFDSFVSINIYIVPILIIWLFIGVHFQKNIIFGFTGAKEVTRKEEPNIYNIVENLCISRGLVTPKIGIIEDSSLNAFATGWSPKKSWIVFSRGLIEQLDEKEIQAVAGHELTHIINGDVKNMVIINVFIGAIGTIGYILMRSGGKNSKGKNPLPILGILLYLASILLLPLINLAISRKKEFLADAGSVDLTKDNLSMISALQKISKNPIIGNISDNGRSVSSMFISNPRKESKIFSNFRGLFSTHPSIESRIEALKLY